MSNYVAVDPNYDHYFVANYFLNSGNDDNQIIEGNISGGAPSVFYTSGNGGEDAIIGLALDPQNGLLYFAVTDANVPGTNTDTGIYDINARGSGVQAATKLVTLSASAHAPNDIAIDATQNLLFYTDGVPGLTNVEEIGVAFLSSGAIINSDLLSYSASGDVEPFGIAVDPATNTLYWTTVNFAGDSGNAIYAAPYVIGASVSLAATTTLATTSEGQAPIGIALDVPANGYFVDTSTGFSNGTTANEVLFGRSLTTPETLVDIYNVPDQNGGTQALPTEAIVLETQPTVIASGTVTFADGGAAVAIDSGATVPANADGDNLASATVLIASGIGTGDTLSFTNQNGINGAFSAGTLTLTGVATEAIYQTALDSVKFSTTSTSTTARTLDWTVSDGVVSSATTTSTVDVLLPPVITGITPDTGTSSTDGTTDTGALTVDGTAAANTTIDVFNGSTLIATGTTGSGSTWTAILGAALPPGDYTLTATATLSGATTGLSSGFAVDVDETAPTVNLDDRVGSTPNNASSDQFTVVFSESVSGVSATSFTLAETGTVGGSIATVGGSGTTYTVTVNNVTGDGTLGLNVKSGGNGIEDAAGNEPGGFTSGQTYTIEHTPPSVTSIETVQASSNSGGTEQFAVTFSESVTGVDKSDFTLVDTGSVSGTISSLSGNGSSYTVTVTGATGSGTMGLDLNSSGTGISDAAGNAISGGFTGGEIYTITPAVATFDAHVYDDTNADGVQDGSETGLAGVTVNLLDGSGNPTGHHGNDRQQRQCQFHRPVAGQLRGGGGRAVGRRGDAADQPQHAEHAQRGRNGQCDRGRLLAARADATGPGPHRRAGHLARQHLAGARRQRRGSEPVQPESHRGRHQRHPGRGRARHGDAEPRVRGDRVEPVGAGRCVHLHADRRGRRHRHRHRRCDRHRPQPADDGGDRARLHHHRDRIGAAADQRRLRADTGR